jgi:hypothetical protein
VFGERHASGKGARTQIRAVTDEGRAAVWNLHRGGHSEISRFRRCPSKLQPTGNRWRSIRRWNTTP